MPIHVHEPKGEDRLDKSTVSALELVDEARTHLRRALDEAPTPQGPLIGQLVLARSRLTEALASLDEWLAGEAQAADPAHLPGSSNGL